MSAQLSPIIVALRTITLYWVRADHVLRVHRLQEYPGPSASSARRRVRYRYAGFVPRRWGTQSGRPQGDDGPVDREYAHCCRVRDHSLFAVRRVIIVRLWPRSVPFSVDENRRSGIRW